LSEQVSLADCCLGVDFSSACSNHHACIYIYGALLLGLMSKRACCQIPGNVKGEDATPFSSPRVFLAIRSMSAIGIICHWSLAPSAVTRFPSWIIIAVIVLPHRGQFRRGSLMRNTCSK